MDQWFCLSLGHSLVKPEQWLQMKIHNRLLQRTEDKVLIFSINIDNQEHHNQQTEAIQGLTIRTKISQPLMFGSNDRIGRLVYIALTLLPKNKTLISLHNFPLGASIKSIIIDFLYLIP